jgi:UDP-N-acetylmuramoyl-tripeptide--D-alanyl-D-alanine ligase
METEELYKHFIECSGISIDTRTLMPGNLFFALGGENFDGHKFVDMALKKGAKAAIISKPEYKSEKTILVEDTLISLQKLANYHRRKLATPIIAITGTNGKTTTKELINSVLSQKFKVSSTQGNYNNHIGVPLTLLALSEQTEIAIVEMGANHLGDIAELCQIAEPDMGLITNIGKAHLEGFGSFDGVIKTKTELYNYLLQKPGSRIFYNESDTLLSELVPAIELIPYGGIESRISGKVELDNNSEFLFFKWNDSESNNWHHVQTKLVGHYNLSNALAAVAIGKHFGLAGKSIDAALMEYTPTNKRSQLVQTEKNTLVLDAYNANPVSMLNALQNFDQMRSNRSKMALLGDMFELGEYSFDEHKKIVDMAESFSSIQFVFVGAEFVQHSNKAHRFFKERESLIDWLLSEKPQEHLILLKASRGMKFEDFVDYL